MADDTTPMQRAPGAGAVRMAAGPRIEEGDTWEFPAEEAPRLDPTQWTPVTTPSVKAIPELVIPELVIPELVPTTALAMPADPAPETQEGTDGTATRTES